MTTGRALVLGLGRFGGGREAIRFLRRRGWDVTVADDAPAENLADEVRELSDDPGLRWALGGTLDDRALADVDLVVANPGVPDRHPALLAARSKGLPVTQEVNLVLEHFPGRVVAVTGTNGKSTTATLTAAALRAHGFPTLLGGNIGHSLLADEARWTADSIAVLELSSFQLERADPEHHPIAGAIFTRVTADHLDRHGDLATYHAAKSRAAAMAREFTVAMADDEVSTKFPSAAARRLTVTTGTPGPDQIGIVDGWIQPGWRERSRLLHVDALALPGGFQAANAMLALGAALALGADSGRVATALAVQRPLPYRLQSLASVRGITVFDNAISTAAESTVSALDTVGGRVHWVGGGKSKDGDYTTLADALTTRAISAHVFGAAAAPMTAALGSRIPCSAHQDLEGALERAWSMARPGDAVLFSPGFASFDQFVNFRQRAERFHRWTARLRTRDHKDRDRGDMPEPEAMA